MPSIIKEVFFPPEAPHEVATLIESSLVYQNSGNYQMAVRSLEQARDMWRNIVHPPMDQTAKKNSFGQPGMAKALDVTQPANDKKLRPEQELFFLMSLGSIYESGGKDEIAIS